MNTYKTFWNRFWAGWIDTLILWPLDIPESLITQSSPKWLLASVLIFKSTAVILYSILMHGWCGQTVGKMLCKVKVVDISERPLTMKQAFLRDGIGIVFVTAGVGFLLMNLDLFAQMILSPSTAPIPNVMWFLVSFNVTWFLLEVITMLTNKKRRALHDYIAGSVVVRLPNKAIQRSARSAA